MLRIIKMNCEDLNEVYTKFWDVLFQIRAELYKNYFLKVNSEPQKNSEEDQMKTIDNLASYKSIEVKDYETQINLYFKKIHAPSQHLLTALLHVYLKLCAIKNEKYQNISTFYKSIAHDCRLSVEYEIKKVKEIVKCENNKVLKIYKESFEKLLHEDYRELMRKSACMISRSNIFLNEVFSNIEENSETNDFLDVNNESMWNSNMALKILVEKKSKIHEILHAPSLKKSKKIVLNNVRIHNYDTNNQLSILLILLQKYKLEKDRQLWLETLQSNPEELSNKIKQFRFLMQNLDNELKIKNHVENKTQITEEFQNKNDLEKTENEKIHCLVLDALKETIKELQIVIDDLHIFSIQCSHILKKIQYQIKSEIKIELTSFQNFQKKKIIQLKESMKKYDFNKDAVLLQSQKLLEESLECILKEFETTEFEKNEEIKLCVASIKNLYEQQNIMKNNKILKNNNEFLLSIVNFLILQIK